MSRSSNEELLAQEAPDLSLNARGSSADQRCRASATTTGRRPPKHAAAASGFSRRARDARRVRAGCPDAAGALRPRAHQIPALTMIA